MPFTFGVEIECLIPVAARNGLRAKIQAAGLLCTDPGRYHSGTAPRGSWKIEADGSLRADMGYATCELVSPVLTEGTEGFEQVEKLCRVLGDVNATVNRSCGLHVHVGIANTPIKAVKKLAELYAKHEVLIDQLIPPSRRGNLNHYCASVATRVNMTQLERANTVRDISMALTGDARHSKLNLSSYWRYSTVEFRHHSGTVDASKIIKWATFCMKMVETAIREADLPIAATAVRSASTATHPYWRRGRRTRRIFELLSRPEGATAEEVRMALGVRTRPGLRWHLIRAEASTTPVGRRNGMEVFRLATSTAEATTPVPVSAPFTLAELYDKLGLADEDKEFWRERVQILSAGTSRRRQQGPVAGANELAREQQASAPAEVPLSELNALLHGRS